MSPVGEAAGELHPQEEEGEAGPGPAQTRVRVRAQIQGLGTALKILFSEKEIQKLPEHSPSKGFQLTRQEIVALINAFGRYALPAAPPPTSEK